MDVKCYVAGCKSGHEKSNDTIYFFRPGNQKTLELWRKAIQKKDHTLENMDAVCSKHFDDADIIKKKTLQGIDGPISVDIDSWKLVDDAIPKLFLGKKSCYYFC